MKSIAYFSSKVKSKISCNIGLLEYHSWYWVRERSTGTRGLLKKFIATRIGIGKIKARIGNEHLMEV